AQAVDRADALRARADDRRALEPDDGYADVRGCAATAAALRRARCCAGGAARADAEPRADADAAPVDPRARGARHAAAGSRTRGDRALGRAARGLGSTGLRSDRAAAADAAVGAAAAATR